MQPSVFAEAVKIWKNNFSKEISVDELKFELDLHKKLLNFFQVGDFYYFIMNLSTVSFDLVSTSITSVLGYDPAEVDLYFLFNCIHPEDQIWYTNFENENVNFLLNLPKEKIPKYKVRMDFRMRKKNGEYIRLMHQSIAIQQYEDGGIFRTLCVHTDITHLKSFGKPVLSYIGLDGEPSYIDVKIGKPLLTITKPLTRREKEILLLMIDGKQNKEIADLLFISKQTVDRHRKNMISKNNFKNSGELIAVAIKNGWI